MASGDDLFKQAQQGPSKLGLSKIPFQESMAESISQTLEQLDTFDYIFTGREQELSQVFTLFQSSERRRILVNGRIGIGKSAFILETLSILKRNRPQMLSLYVSLPPELDLATTALIALAQAMPDDEFAQRQLFQMGIPVEQVPKEKSSKGGLNLPGISLEVGQTDLSTSSVQYPSISFETLLDRARKKYPDGVLIAMDDLDKKEPRRVRELMHDAQGLLKGKAWWILTAHPIGITGDLLTSERGLFDLKISLEELDEATTYQMLINYLNSARLGERYEEPTDPRSVLPFIPDTAKLLCKASQGKPRLFNRLGYHVLSTAAIAQSNQITPDILKEGLKKAELSSRDQAKLQIQEKKILAFLKQRGQISDETITIQEMQTLGFSSFTEMYPFLERLEQYDLAYRLNRDDVTAYETIQLSLPETKGDSFKDEKSENEL